MKWFLIGAVAVGAGVLLLSNRGGNTGGFNPGFGMAYAGDPYYGASLNNAYGMAFYGGFQDMQQAPQGYWKPSMLEGR